VKNSLISFCVWISANLFLPAFGVENETLIQNYLLVHPISQNGFKNVEKVVNDCIRQRSYKVYDVIEPKQVIFSIYPIISRRLIADIKNTTLYSSRTDSPFFLIGDDNLSKAWLKAKKDYLKLIHATGYIVSVEGEESVIQLKKEVPELHLYALQADILADIFSIKHYPLLVMPCVIDLPCK